jgi:hypothetical protein
MRIPHITVFALLAALAVPATAAAHNKGPSTFERTFRAESRLCSAVAAGNVPTPLQGHEAEVTGACAALHSAFDAAVAAASAGTDSSVLKDAVAQVQTACAGDTVDQEACAEALADAYKSLKSAHHGNRSTKRAYRRAIAQARHAFRRSVKALVVHRVHKHEAPKPDAPAGDDHQAGDDAPTGDAPTGDGPATDVPTDD